MRRRLHRSADHLGLIWRLFRHSRLIQRRISPPSTAAAVSRLTCSVVGLPNRKKRSYSWMWSVSFWSPTVARFRGPRSAEQPEEVGQRHHYHDRRADHREYPVAALGLQVLGDLQIPHPLHLGNPLPPAPDRSDSIPFGAQLCRPTRIRLRNRRPHGVVSDGNRRRQRVPSPRPPGWLQGLRLPLPARYPARQASSTPQAPLGV